MPQPPLLCEEGNTPHSTFLQFIHTFYDRRYSVDPAKKPALIFLRLRVAALALRGAPLQQAPQQLLFDHASNNGNRDSRPDRTNSSYRPSNCANDLLERLPFILQRTHGRKNDAAAFGRSRCGLDHLSVVFSIDAARRIPLRPRTGKLCERESADAGACVPDDAGDHLSPHAFCDRARCRSIEPSDVVVARPTDQVGGNTVRRGIDDGAPPAELVVEDGDNLRSRSVFPLCRQQPRKPARLAGVSIFN